MTNSPTFNPGDQVYQITAPDRVGVVTRAPKRSGPITFYPVIFSPPTVEWVAEENLAAFVGQGVDSLLEQGIFAGHAAFSRLVTFTKLSIPLSDTLYSYLASRTDLYPYQYKPLLKFLESENKRLLIADEVGLGKTIEAGLILVELRMREDLQRVLIVCPASLRAKWREEMARRFDEHFDFLDKAGFKRLLHDVSERGGAVGFRAIVTFGPVRSPDVMELLEAQAPPIDLLIVDEAHHLRNPETLTHKAIRFIADAADAVLLLTATPVHLGNQNLLALLSLLDHEEFNRMDVFDRRMRANRFVVRAERLLLSKSPDILTVRKTLMEVERTTEADRFLATAAYTEFLARTADGQSPSFSEIVELQALLGELNLLSHILSRSRKVEVQPDRPRRDPQVQKIVFKPLEMEIYKCATNSAGETWRRYGRGSVDTFRAIARQRQIASCLPAALMHFQAKKAQADDVPSADELTDLDSEEWELKPSANVPFEEPLLPYFARVAELERMDTKFAALCDALNSLEREEKGRKVIVFAYFKATLYYLERRLSDLGFKTIVLTGDVPSRPGDPSADERGQRIREFREDPSVQIMLSSEVGSEGLDFQFCHILVNYDLPWNPMVVEQRIGRLDRLGQKSKRIIIINLSVADTIEDRILQRLYERIGIFKESIGDLEAILGTVVSELRTELLTSTLSPEELDDVIGQRAMAVERERNDERELEKKAEELLGHDDVFAMQLKRRRNLRQYVGAEELAIFVAQFLKERFHNAKLRYDYSTSVGEVVVTDDLLTFIRRHTAQGDPIVHNFIQRTLRGSCRVTFDSAMAAQDQEIEYMAAHHPLIRSIVAEYKTDSSVLTPTSIVGLSTSRLSPGEYLYSLDLVNVTGVRPRKYLDPILVSISDGSVVDEESAREVMGLMVEKGVDVDRAVLEVDTSALMEFRNVASGELGRRVERRREALGRSNDVLADARIASLTASHEAKTRMKRELLTKAKEGNKAPRYIRMLEGEIRNREASFKARVEEVDAARSFDVSYEEIGAGIVVISAEQD